MKARCEKPCTDSENVWGLPLASAFPACIRWRFFPRGMDTASKPSAIYARRQGWQQTLGCQQNAGRSRRRWERCMRQRARLRKRARRGRRLRGSSGGWQGASRMRRGVRAFWLGGRFTPCCSTSKAMLEEKTINQTRNKKSTSGPRLPGPYMFTLLLTWTAGCLDAISYIRFTVFPANITGNTVLIGIGIGTGQVEHILLSGVALLAYCLGVFLAAIVIKREEKQYPWTGRFLATLIIEKLALLSFAFFLLF